MVETSQTSQDGLVSQNGQNNLMTQEGLSGPGQASAPDPGAGMTPPDAVLLTRAVERGLISSDQARTVAERTGAGNTAADLLVTQGFLSREMVKTLSDSRRSTSMGPPKAIAGFDIGEVLGEGGMGCVYRAVQRSLSRPVALKVISGQLAKDAESSERFLREARAAGAINHPNVITCFDVGVAGDRLYMALELVTGGDAAQLAKACGGRLPERRVVEIAVDATRGLCAVARAGLIHRDIKPSNIFITEDGLAKLADLGLARTMDGEDRMTHTGRAMGTPAFMSPEQARGDADVDIRSDICALGASMYALAVGRPPYEGSSPWVVVSKVMSDVAPDPRSQVPALSVGFCKVIARALARDREQRYPRPEHMLSDLERLLAGQEPLLDQAMPGSGFLRRPPSSGSTMQTFPGIPQPQPRKIWPLLTVGIGMMVATLLTIYVWQNLTYTEEATDKENGATTPVESRGFFQEKPKPKPVVPPTPSPATILAAEKFLPIIRQAAGPSASVVAQVDGTLAVFDLSADFRDLTVLSGQPIGRLSLKGCRRISDLRLLMGHGIYDLDLTGLDAIDDLRGLEALPLRRLILRGALDLDGDLKILAGKPITTLDLHGCAELTGLNGIEGFALTELDLTDCASLRGDLVALTGMPLRSLTVTKSRLENLTGINALPLTKLVVRGNSRLTDVSGIESLPLTYLDLSANPRLSDKFDGAPVLRQFPLKSLQHLLLSDCPWMVDLLTLASAPQLVTLDLSNNPHLTGDLSPLAPLQLQELNLSGNTGLSGFSGLTKMPLKKLIIKDMGALSQGKNLTGLIGRPDLVIIR